MPTLLTTAGSRPEAELICARLSEAGIETIIQGGAFTARAAEVGARDIYVPDGDLDRAREILAEGEEITEDELIRASEEAGRASGEPAGGE